MPHYFKKYWNETTGEALTDSWGVSTYYFETDDKLTVTRQVQVFENGQVLKYDAGFIQDEFGALSDQPLDPDELEGCAIDEAVFTAIWNHRSRNTA